MADVNTTSVLSVYTTVNSKLSDFAQKDGQLIFVQDKQMIALDFGGKRKFYNQIEELSSEESRTSLLAPITGRYYFVMDPPVLWRYQESGWVQITTPPNDVGELSSTVVDLSNVVSANYDESIIGLSVDGQTITYIKGDGSVHTIVTQDTNTEYFLGTDETTGLTKLYATVGSAEDGTMTQKAIKTELDKKVGVAIDTAQNTLIFTI